MLDGAVAAVTALATMLLGLGERDAVLPTIAVLVAAASFYAVDYKGWFHLHPIVANTAGLVAVSHALYFVGQRANDSWLLTIAHLLAYLQFILVFQAKTNRHYWLLLMLGLLQAAVACALNYELVFGVLLMLYVGTGLLALGLFFQVRERARYESAGTAAAVERRAGGLGSWQPGVGGDPDEGKRNSAAGWQWARAFLFCIATAAAVFTLFPRVDTSRARWGQTGAPPPLRASGYSETVSINDMGVLLEDRSPVLKLRLYDVKSGAALPPLPSVRLRGSIQTQYAKGNWKRGAMQSVEGRPLAVEPPDDVQSQLVLQSIDLEPTPGTNALFGIFPWAAVDPRSDVQYQTPYFQLSRPTSQRNAKFRYELYTWGIENGQQRDRAPNYVLWPRWKGRQDALIHASLTPEQYVELTKLPKDDDKPMLPRLEALAPKIAPRLPWPEEPPRRALVAVGDPPKVVHSLDGFARFPEGQVERLAFTLRDHLKLSNEFRYSLRATPIDLTIDPVEDFLINRKEGHCEYYATALVLLLRAHGVPARLASGYSGAEWNPLGGFYQVRQYHAHSWAECYLPDGSWLTLDPTPAREREAAFADVDSWYFTIQSTLDALDFYWTVYILGLDANRQQAEIYGPLAGFAGALQKLWPFSADGGFEGLPGVGSLSVPWPVWMGLVLVLAGAFLLVSRRRKSAEIADDEGTDVWEEAGVAETNLFLDMQRLLEKHSLTRSPAQTPREFARLAAVWLSYLPGGGSVAPVPRRIVEAYYRVRYGGARLTAREFVALRSSLLELETALESLAAGSPILSAAARDGASAVPPPSPA